MKSGFLFFFLIIAFALFAPRVSLASDQGDVPENNFAALKPKIRQTSKDTSAIRAWMEKNLRPSADPTVMLSAECRDFSNDVSESVWGYDGSITADQMNRKWGRRFDLKNTWDHAFEDGNCGWASRKLSAFKYLGELNGGDWFLLGIKGGCGESDYSRSLSRVVKVETRNGRYQITNLVNPRAD